ncbi:MAG: M20/M25/M40 family metallo-hydrolase [Clostridia bacterium]|nr:M20/M25/M40 family metallo-hydrolase [Clostridia bacterium]
MMDLINKIEGYYDGLLKLHKELCLIPAPSHFEDERAAYVLKFLKELGIDNAYIDKAKNVIWTLGKPSDKMVVFMAHTDTVFPMETPLNYVDDGEKIHCPGAGDDTGSLAGMLTCVKFMVEHNIVPERTLMFVANSCEEGLGNLKGTRQLFEDFGDKIEYLYTFDSAPTGVTNKSVGSHRYEVTAITEGGHSFGAFGNRNAINVLAWIINEIYKIEVPVNGDSRTTYNVGIINGGTSVNTIAQNASMLCEYRSDDVECLAIMEQKYKEIFEAAKSKCQELKIELVGNRPCMSNELDMDKLQEITDRAKAIQAKHFGVDVKEKSGSTDCNIPHSLAIPAVALSNYRGGGAHTREEWVEKESFKAGMRVGLELMLVEGGLM